MMGIIVIILAIFISIKICNALFANTIGTTSAYLWRIILVFFVVLAILSGVLNKIGLL